MYQVDSYVLFWTSGIKLGDKVAFQVYLNCPDHIDLCKLPIASVRLFFAQGGETIRVDCAGVGEGIGPSDNVAQLLDVGNIKLSNGKEHSVSQHIDWRSGRRPVVLRGTVEAGTATELKVRFLKDLFI